MNMCGHCGGFHVGACPAVKAVDYYPDGTVRRIEYREPLWLTPSPPVDPHYQTPAQQAVAHRACQ
jgi:hypothetical protein